MTRNHLPPAAANIGSARKRFTIRLTHCASFIDSLPNYQVNRRVAKSTANVMT